MGRGGARPGAGAKKRNPENHGRPDKYEAIEIIDLLGKPSGHEASCTCWKCLWKKDAERLDAVGQAARKYLWDRYKGKPVDTVNHLHDKPIQHEVTVTIAELVRKVRLRKLEYERNKDESD